MTGLAYGLVDRRAELPQALGTWCHDATLSWTRWSHGGPVWVDPDPNRLLAHGVAQGAGALLLQHTGHVLVEAIRPKGRALDLGPHLARQLQGALAVGHPGCVLVDLVRWCALDRPRLTWDQGRFERGVVRPLDPETARSCVDLDPVGAPSALQAAIDGAPRALSAPAERFFADTERRVTRCPRGVFVFNIEGYDDVDALTSDAPLDTLVSVAAGFKPLRILHRLGFSAHTRVVLADYSAPALALHRALVQTWSGRDLPDHLRALHADGHLDGAHLYLRSTDAGGPIDWDELQGHWHRELDEWGGADAFAQAWRAARALPTQWLHADLVNAPAPVLDLLQPHGHHAIWWSNAFFSIVGLWRMSARQRQQVFAAWIDALADRAPELLLLGADHHNQTLSGLRAAHVRARLDACGDLAHPRALSSVRVRS